MSCCKKAGQKHSMNIANRSFEAVAKLNYFGTTIADQNCMNEEIKSRINLWNACYHLIKSLLTSCLLSRNVKVKISFFLAVALQPFHFGLGFLYN
jgi:hypothetical protein